jgi:hypothetical protein
MPDRCPKKPRQGGAEVPIPDETVVQAIKSAAKRLLREACERAVVDGNVTSQETQELISLRQRVGLDEREHAAIFLVAAQTYAQQLFEQAMAGISCY